MPKRYDSRSSLQIAWNSTYINWKKKRERERQLFPSRFFSFMSGNVFRQIEIEKSAGKRRHRYSQSFQFQLWESIFCRKKNRASSNIFLCVGPTNRKEGNNADSDNSCWYSPRLNRYKRRQDEESIRRHPSFIDRLCLTDRSIEMMSCFLLIAWNGDPWRWDQDGGSADVTHTHTHTYTRTYT